MPLFIKTETIKDIFLLKINLKKKIIKEHIKWVKNLKKENINIVSGYLVDKYKQAGGGGILFIECDSYKNAENILVNDPMIKNNLVNWELHEWINIL